MTYPSDSGAMLRAFAALVGRVGHLDNTRAPCRVAFDGYHDACSICEVIGVTLAAMRERGLDATMVRSRMPDLSLADMRAAAREVAP